MWVGFGCDELGSITNYFQFFLLYQFSKYNRTSDIAHAFNIWSPSTYFAAYGDHLLFEWYLDGLIGQQSLADLYQGYTDPTLTNLVESNNAETSCCRTERRLAKLRSLD